MSQLHVRHIRVALERAFENKIDMSDYAKKQTHEKEAKFLSRALAAYSIQYYGDIDDNDAAACVVDDFDDNGIDAIKYDNTSNKLFLVQSKWMNDGNGCPSSSDTKKFADGIRDLLNSNWDRFNEKIKSKTNDIITALDDPNTRIIIIVAYTGNQKLATHPMRDLDDLTKELNTPSEMATLHCFSLSEIHKAISGSAKPEAITFKVHLREWGQITDPYKSVFGYVVASDIALLWQDHGEKLLAKNIRKFLGDTNINESIQNTLIQKPENFWFFNNGITILCTEFNRAPYGGTSHDVGLFECVGASIVNGAQTIGNIGRSYDQNKDAVEKAKVHVRLISLEGCPEGYDSELTQATNTQNKIEKKDFVSLDVEQERLRTEIHIELQKKYIYKTGEQKTQPEEGCSIEEAIVALACNSRNLDYAILSKKEVGKLWEDIKHPPYTQLFNKSLTGRKLWNLVELLRIVEMKLKQIQIEKTGPSRNIAVHGNRFILFEVLKTLSTSYPDFGDPTIDMEMVKALAEKHTVNYYEKTCQAQVELYPDAVIGRMFYNKEKWRNMDDKVNTVQEQPEEQ